MKKSYLAILIIGVSITLAAETPTCTQFVLKVVAHHHSKATLKKWADWRQQHPHWVPATPQETLARLNFACNPIETKSVGQSGFILPQDGPQWIDTESVQVPVEETKVAEYAQVQLEPNWTPLVSTVTPMAPIPEPSTFYLALTGLFFVFSTLYIRNNNAPLV